MEQGDGLDQLFGEPLRETGELPAQTAVRRPALPTRGTRLPQAPTGSTLPQVGSTPPARPVVSQSLTVQPPAVQQPVHQPAQPLSNQSHMVAPPVSPPATPPARAPARRDPNAPFDFQLRPRRVPPRTTPLEWLSLAFAIVVPPLGLVLSIVARGIARGQRRWRTRVASVATTVSVILSVLVGAGTGVYLESQRLATIEAERASMTLPLCSLQEQVPGVLQSPTFGWPPVGESIPESVASIEAYYTQWNYLARVLPAEIKADAAAVATAADEILSQIEETTIVDEPGNVNRMTTVVAGLGIEQWAAKYCG